MARALPWVLALVLALGFTLKLDRALRQPLGLQAAATASLARSLVQAGWHPLGEVALLADASFSAQGFQRSACTLEVALLPPGPQYLDVVREAWGERAQLLEETGFGTVRPGEERWRQLGRQLRHVLGLGPRPALFGLAAASRGACPPDLWRELDRLGQ